MQKLALGATGCYGKMEWLHHKVAQDDGRKMQASIA